MTDTAKTTKPKRRLWQYSLRTLLILVTLAAGLLVAWRVYVEPFRRQQETMALIKALGGTSKSEAGGLAWMRNAFGARNFQDVTFADVAECDDPNRYLQQIVSLPRLQTLVVGGRRFGDEHLRQLAKIETLGGLVLDSTSVTEKAIAALKREAPHLVVHQSQRRAIATVRNFRSAELLTESTAIHPQLRRLVGGEHFEHAAWASLRSCDITDADLAHLEGWTELRLLLLSDTKITDAGVAKLKGLTKLRVLHLENTAVTDAGLANFKDCADMLNLLLQNTRISDAGLAHLKGMPRLRLLHLDQTDVSDAGLTHLMGLTNLALLTVNSTYLSDQALKKLSKALPKCDIPNNSEARVKGEKKE